jgi:hypothetical protein
MEVEEAMRYTRYVRMHLAAAAVVIALLAGCYYTPAGGTAGANVALARALGSNVGEITLTVSGPGMKTIVKQYGADSTGDTLEVPAGIELTFTVTASTPSATLSDAVTVDLNPGESRQIVLDPKLSATKILAPDLNNGRIVQIDDMKGAGWIEKYETDYPPAYYLRPYEIDFDDQGRMYVASEWDPAGVAGLFRVDDILNTSSYLPIESSMTVTTLAVDRKNNYVYYATDGNSIIYRKSLSNLSAAAEEFDIPAEGGIETVRTYGIAVDDGVLYIADHSAYLIYKYDTSKPVGSRIAKTYTAVTYPYDVMVKGDDVYVSDIGTGGATPGAKIIRLNRDLELVDEYTGPAGDPLWGPDRFLARLDRKIVVIDEAASYATGNLDRIVSMDDMAGRGWETYGTEGSLEGQFAFLRNYAY